MFQVNDNRLTVQKWASRTEAFGWLLAQEDVMYSSLNNHDGNRTKKTGLLCFKRPCDYSNSPPEFFSTRTFLDSSSKRIVSKFGKLEQKSFPCVYVRHKMCRYEDLLRCRAVKAKIHTKKWDACAELFCSLNLLLISRSRCCRCRVCVSSSIKLASFYALLAK